MKLLRKSQEKQAEIQKQQSQRGAAEGGALLFLLFLLAFPCFSKTISLILAGLGKIFLILHDFGLIFLYFGPGFGEKA